MGGRDIFSYKYSMYIKVGTIFLEKCPTFETSKSEYKFLGK